MITAAQVFAVLAALLHVYVFVLESFLWTTSRTRATFGTTPENAEATKLLAFNQGFYNVFLAIVTGVGVAWMRCAGTAVGAGLVFAGVGSMFGAAIVLLASSPRMVRSALAQGVLPLITLVLLSIGLNIG